MFWRGRAAEILAQHTGQPVEKVLADFDRDRFMSAEEARDYRLIDEVFSSRKVQTPAPGLELAAAR